MANRPQRKVTTFYQPYAGTDATRFDKPSSAVSQYREANDGLASLSDDDIVEVLESLPGSGSAIEEARAEALVTANAEAESSVDVPTGGKDVGVLSTTTKEMMEIGRLFPAAMNDLIVTTADKKEEADGSVVLMVKLIDETPELAKALDAPDFPRPGTRWDSVEGERGFAGNFPPDHYGTGSKREGSRFEEVFAGSGAAQVMRMALGILSRLGDNKEAEPDDEKNWNALPNECKYSELTRKQKKQAAKSRWQRRYGQSVQRFRSAQLYRLQRAAIEGIPGMVVDWIDTDVTTVGFRRNAPVMIQHSVEGRKTADQSDAKSIGTINRIDVAKAEAKARAAGRMTTIDDLLSTVRKPPRAGGKADIPANPSSLQVPLFLVGLSNFFDKDDGFEARMTELHKGLQKPGQDDNIEAMLDVYLALRSLVGKDAPFQKRAAEIKELRRKSDNGNKAVA